MLLFKNQTMHKPDTLYKNTIFLTSLFLSFIRIASPLHYCYNESITIKHINMLSRKECIFTVSPPIIYYLLSEVLKISRSLLPLNYINENVDLLMLRLFGMIIFSLTVVYTYKILRLIMNENISLFISMFIVFENSFISYYKFVNGTVYNLFINILLIYAFGSYYCCKKVIKLYYIGIISGIGVSLSLNNLCTFIPIVLYLIVDTFYVSIDTNRAIFYGKNSVLSNIIHRIVSIIVIPFFLYLSTFYIFFYNQKVSSEYSYLYSLEYQTGLLNNQFEYSDKFVVDRSLITLRNVFHKSYLKSEEKNFEEGSKQQIVFGDPIKNDYSIWRMVKIHVQDDPSKKIEDENEYFLRNNDNVKLEHVMTNRYLHSHPIPLKSSTDKRLKEVTCYGKVKEGITDDNDFWIVKCDTEYLMARISKINLFHTKTGGLLGMKYKEENVDEMAKNEVYTSGDGAHSHRPFYIEDCVIDPYYITNFKDVRINEKIKLYRKLSFLEKFGEYHDLMKNSERVKVDGKIKTSFLYLPLMKKPMECCDKFGENLDKENQGDKKYLRNGKIFKNEHIIVEGNIINWKIHLLVFIFPLFGIINKAIYVRSGKGTKIHGITYMLFYTFLINYLKLCFSDDGLVLSDYFYPFYLGLIVSLYLISKMGKRIVFVALTISFSCFLKKYIVY